VFKHSFDFGSGVQYHITPKLRNTLMAKQSRPKFSCIA